MDVRARKNLIPFKIGKGRLLNKLSDQADTFAHKISVARVFEIVHQDARRIARIGRAQLNFAAAMRPHQPNMNLKGMLLKRRPCSIIDRNRRNDDLQIRIVHARPRADTAQTFKQVRGDDAAACHHPLNPGP